MFGQDLTFKTFPIFKDPEKSLFVSKKRPWKPLGASRSMTLKGQR